MRLSCRVGAGAAGGGLRLLLLELMGVVSVLAATASQAAEKRIGAHGSSCSARGDSSERQDLRLEPRH